MIDSGSVRIFDSVPFRCAIYDVEIPKMKICTPFMILALIFTLAAAPFSAAEPSTYDELKADFKAKGLKFDTISSDFSMTIMLVVNSIEKLGR